jgi:putative FmdB family regulatory protein
MPTYEYRCPEGHEFEKFYRTISGAPTAVNCPVCGKPAERQLSGGAGLLFKGSGFYLTDYGKNAHANKGPKPAPTESGKSESSSSGDSKSSTDKSSASNTGSSGSGQASSGSASGSGSSGASGGASSGGSGGASGGASSSGGGAGGGGGSASGGSGRKKKPGGE